ncbi:MAG: efflux RND transporter permease subunit, partial [Holophagales bacterium]|nr:efflux RND transporter permease subunit [Holophagales bacterium]
MKAVLEASIRRPVATVVGGLLLLLFGALALLRIPIQLTPTLEAPQLTVSTSWPGASPQEVERELVLRQEEQLESLEGLVRMESTSMDGLGQIELSFVLGTDLDLALVRASNALQRVRERPP